MIPAQDLRWKTAAKASEILSPPLDLSPRGVKAWVVLILDFYGGLPAGSPERRAFIEEAKKQFWYVQYLFKGRKALHAALADCLRTLEERFDTQG